MQPLLERYYSHELYKSLSPDEVGRLSDERNGVSTVNVGITKADNGLTISDANSMVVVGPTGEAYPADNHC